MRVWRWLVLVVGLLLCVVARGQSMREVFAAMPRSVCVWLSHDDRLDLIDFKESGMRARVETAGGVVELEVLTDRYACLRTSSASRVELRLLEGKKGCLVCGVFTYLTPVEESCVRFFTPTWEEVDGRKLVEEPRVEDFIKAGTDRDVAGRIEKMVGGIGGRLSADEESLTFSLDVWGQNGALKEELEGCLEDVVLRWNGKRFETPLGRSGK